MKRIVVAALESFLFPVVGFIALANSPACLAAVATVRPGATDDFRAAFASPQDVAEGKRLADASCAGCHGSLGISAAQGVPHLAGQRAVYLHSELQAYKSESRGKGVMADATRYLSDTALLQVAAWYASLDPAGPAPLLASVKAVPSGQDPASAGKAAAASCAGCHGDAGISRTPGMPNLVGQDPMYLAAATGAYKKGQRENGIMKAMVAAIGDTDINNIALFYATQKPGRAQTPAPGNKAAGKAAAAACGACHGEAGVSTGAAPSLAGQDAQYFVAAMRAYRDGSRNDPVMKGQAASIPDGALADLAAWYASLEPQPPKLERVLTVAELAQRCDRCHGVNGNSTDPRLPGLAAQREEYLARALNDYRTGTRKSSAMLAMSKSLTETDIGLLAAHYARQKARAVVYVILPAPK